MKNFQLVLNFIKEYTKKTSQPVRSVYVGNYLYDCLEFEMTSMPGIGHLDEGVQFELTFPDKPSIMFYRMFALRENSIKIGNIVYDYKDLSNCDVANTDGQKKCICTMQRLLTSGCKCGGV